MNFGRTHGILSLLKKIGGTFALDDFGTGYSSLSGLSRLPLDQLKIDQSFVREMLADSSAASIVVSIIDLSKSLGLKVIAEGVETEEQRDFLYREGCEGALQCNCNDEIESESLNLFFGCFSKILLLLRFFTGILHGTVI